MPQSWSVDDGLETEKVKPLWTYLHTTFRNSGSCLHEALALSPSHRQLPAQESDLGASCRVELGGSTQGSLIVICYPRADRLTPHSPAMNPVDCHLL